VAPELVVEFVRIGLTMPRELGEFGGPFVVDEDAVEFWCGSIGLLIMNCVRAGGLLNCRLVDVGLLGIEVMRSTSMLGWDEGWDEDVALVRLELGSPLLLRAAVSVVLVVDVESVGICIGIGAS